MKTTQEMISVMQAYSDGKPIEARLLDCKLWRNIPNPSWNWNEFEYRVQAASPGQIAWEAYRKATAEADCISLQAWDALPCNVQERWHAVAKACRETKP